MLALPEKEIRMRDAGAREDRRCSGENRFPVRFKRINALTKPEPGQDHHQRKRHAEHPIQFPVSHKITSKTTDPIFHNT